MHIANILKKKELSDNSVIKDFLITASDGKQYNVTQMFFAEIQNKLLYAVTHNTVAEIVVSRADTSKQNMVNRLYQLFWSHFVIVMLEEEINNKS